MEQLKAHLDFETRSPVDLVKAGVYRYAEHPDTAPWCFSYRMGHGAVLRWRPGASDPTELLTHIALGGILTGHNAAFERTIWNVILCRMYPHWPRIEIEQQDCTMARAAAISHPQALSQLCAALATEHQKDKDGHNLMMKMSRPRKYNQDGSIVWWDEPYNVERLMQYCDTDVLTETDIDDRIPPLTEYEYRVWVLDQVINERGIYIDLPAVTKCVTLVELAKKAADKEMRSITDRQVPKCSNDAKLIAWINSKGIECTTVKKGDKDDLMFLADLHSQPKVRAAIELRSDAKKTSTAKYKAMTECVCADGRIRGMLNYHGAGPGRWAGRLVQFQNFPRVDHEKEGYTFEWLLGLLDSEMSAPQVFEYMTAIYGESGEQAPLRLLSRMLRAVMKAAPGHKLIGGDFSNIEGRINAYLAGEHWKIKAFAEYDAGTGPDLYNLAYARSFGVDIKTVDKPKRQIGKVQELALGYQGGVGAYINMGDNYGLNPYDLTLPVKQATSSKQWDETAYMFAKTKDKNGLQEEAWTALKILVVNWRNANPAIVQSWWDLQDAAINAVSTPGIAVPVLMGRVTYYCDGRCLWCILPSGRMICYASPTVESSEEEYIDKYTGETKTRMKNKVAFWGYKEGQWKKLYLYGGLQCENIVQGTARCIMVDRMFAVEQAGYPIILTVHDELVAEVDKSRTDLDHIKFESIMSTIPGWASGLPLTAKAWEDERYIK